MCTLFGVGMAIYIRLDDPAASGSGVCGLIASALTAGVPFGLVTGFLLGRAHRRATAAAGLNDPSELETVSRVIGRGEAPTDPRLRAAARDLAIH